MGDEEVGIEAHRRARVEQQLFEGDGALRHDAGVLHHQRVAGHQVRPGDAGELVVGEVPGLHAEDHADRAALHMRFADRRVQLDGGQEAFGVPGVVSENPRAEFDLATGLADPLAHLLGHCVGEGVGLLMQQLGGLGDDHRPLGIGLVTPRLEAGGGGRNRRLQFRPRHVVEALDRLAAERIDAVVGHGWGSSILRFDAPRHRRLVIEWSVAAFGRHGPGSAET